MGRSQGAPGERADPGLSHPPQCDPPLPGPGPPGRPLPQLPHRSDWSGLVRMPAMPSAHQLAQRARPGWPGWPGPLPAKRPASWGRHIHSSWPLLALWGWPSPPGGLPAALAEHLDRPSPLRRLPRGLCIPAKGQSPVQPWPQLSTMGWGLKQTSCLTALKAGLQGQCCLRPVQVCRPRCLASPQVRHHPCMGPPHSFF